MKKKMVKVAKGTPLPKVLVVLKRNEREIEKRKSNRPILPQFQLKKFLQMVYFHMVPNMNIQNRLTCRSIPSSLMSDSSMGIF